ncbi:MAG: hypothetical protein V1729_06175 [Candidatus Woesearchaeota archaeon]
MEVEREHIATFVVATIAVLVIVGGFASFSGLSVYDQPLKLELQKTEFMQGDVFDANVVVNPVTFMADETIMVYIDGNAVAAIALKRYLDDNDIDYGSEVKNLGQNNVEIINLQGPLTVNLADYVSMEPMYPGTVHILSVEFSQGDAAAQESFRVG